MLLWTGLRVLLSSAWALFLWCLPLLLHQVLWKLSQVAQPVLHLISPALYWHQGSTAKPYTGTLGEQWKSLPPDSVLPWASHFPLKTGFPRLQNGNTPTSGHLGPQIQFAGQTPPCALMIEGNLPFVQVSLGSLSPLGGSLALRLPWHTA